MSVLNVAETDILQQQNLWCLSCKKHCTVHRIYLFQLLFHLVPHASIFHGVLHFHTHRLGMHTEAGARALRALIGFDCPDRLHHHTLSPQLSFSTAQGLQLPPELFCKSMDLQSGSQRLLGCHLGWPVRSLVPAGGLPSPLAAPSREFPGSACSGKPHLYKPVLIQMSTVLLQGSAFQGCLKMWILGNISLCDI